MDKKIINVKGLEHSEREKLIFSAIDSAQKGDCFKLIVEFNPIPIAYMLKGMKDFEIRYEKEGPDEWILDVKKISSGNKKEELKSILRELKDDKVSPETKQRAKDMLKGIDATTIGLLEQELIREGITTQEIKDGLCDLHLEAMGEELIKNRIEVKSPHPIHTLMEEHKLIVEGLEKLDSIINNITKIDNYSDFDSEIPKLQKVAHLFIDAENHHKREEEFLFPNLRKHNIVEPPNIMEEDHKEFIKIKKELFKLVNNPEDYDFEEFKKKVIEYGGYLVKELKSHIFKEDNILYQMALQVLSEKEWAEIKKESDKLGYCCFKPEDQREKNNKEEIVKVNTKDIKSFVKNKFNPKVIYQTEDIKVVIAYFKKGQFIPVHTPNVDVVLCILEGEAEVVAGDETTTAKRDDIIIVPKGVKRGVKALTEELTVLHVVQPSPSDKDHEEVHEKIHAGRFK